MSASDVTMFVAGFGYAETSALSINVMRTRTGCVFGAALDAVSNLAHALLVLYLDEYDTMSAEKPLDLRQGFSGWVRWRSRADVVRIGGDIDEVSPWHDVHALTEILDTTRSEIIQVGIYAERVLALALEGTEFEDPGHRHHEFSEALLEGVTELWADVPYVEHKPTDRAHLGRILDTKHRLGTVAPKTPTLAQVLEGAERAQKRVATWPDWKREFSDPKKGGA